MTRCHHITSAIFVASTGPERWPALPAPQYAPCFTAGPAGGRQPTDVGRPFLADNVLSGRNARTYSQGRPRTGPIVPRSRRKSSRIRGRRWPPACAALGPAGRRGAAAPQQPVEEVTSERRRAEARPIRRPADRELRGLVARAYGHQQNKFTQHRTRCHCERSEAISPFSRGAGLLRRSPYGDLLAMTPS